MAHGMPICLNMHQSTKVHLMVDGKYVRARNSRNQQVELILEEAQENPDCVQRFTCVQETKKYVAFRFTYESKCYSPKIEGGTLKLVSDPSVLGWLEMENIQGGESHYLSTTAGQTGVQFVSENKNKLCVGKPVIFTQVPCS